MKKCLMLIFLVSPSAFANIENASSPIENKLALSFNTIKSSEQNRKNKKYNLSFGSGKELGLNGLSAELGYFYNPNTLMHLRYTKVDEDSRLGFENSAVVKFGMTKFIANSLYYKLGGYYLSSNTKHYEKDGDNRYEAVKSTFNELGASVSIGNQRHWDNFTIGTDWVGINRTLFELNKLTEPFKRVSLTTISLLNMHIGYSF